MSGDPRGSSRARELAERVLASDARAASRLMTLVDDESPLGLSALARLHREGPEAATVGITGAPGSGKSTLVDQMIVYHRSRGRKVGVVAVDPTSPISGGAVLADRVRMQRHALDEGVFIRSLASRGERGGLSLSASAAARILEAMGFDQVLIETVGTGQLDVEISRVADTVVFVSAPGMGDDVQAMKAGVLEIPDIFAVNKADREGADLVARHLEAMLHLRAADDRGQSSSAPAWVPPVVKTVASTGEGVEALIAEIARHRSDLEREGTLLARRISRARCDVEARALRRLRQAMLEAIGGETALDEAAVRVASRASDSLTEVDRLLAFIEGSG